MAWPLKTHTISTDITRLKRQNLLHFGAFATLSGSRLGPGLVIVVAPPITVGVLRPVGGVRRHPAIARAAGDAPRVTGTRVGAVRTQKDAGRRTDQSESGDWTPPLGGKMVIQKPQL